MKKTEIFGLITGILLVFMLAACTTLPPASKTSPPPLTTLPTPSSSPTPSPVPSQSPSPSKALTSSRVPTKEPEAVTPPDPTPKLEIPPSVSPSPQVAFSILASGAFTTFAPLDFSVEIKANLPSDFEWVWYWSDASPTETAFPPDAFTNHLFKEPRKYVVTLKLRSPASNSILGTAVKDIVIDDLNALKKMQTLRLALLNIYLRGSERPKDVVIIAPLYMQRNIFSTKWQTKVGNTTTTHSIEGEVSEDERTLLSATWVADTFEPGTQGTLFVGHEKLAVKNVPLDNRSLSVFSGKLERDKVKSNVLYEYSSANEGNRIVDWDNPRASPRFECEFK